MPAGPRNLRPSYKHVGSNQEAEEYAKQHKNLRYRRNLPYSRIRFVNVHTSPGKSTPTIHQQVNKIIGEVNELRKEEPNTMMGGDFYMQKSSKTNWERLTSGKGDLRAVEPGVPTNFKYGKGVQTADHFVTPASWKQAEAHALPPMSAKELSFEELKDKGQDPKELVKWEGHGIDHAFVVGSAQVPVQETVSNLALFLARFFHETLYQQNNCLIHAIATAANVGVTEEIIQAIRNELSDNYGIDIGAYIEANEDNITVIMHELNLYGVVHIHNVDAPELDTMPVAVLKGYSEDAVQANIDINYSHYHFFAAPGN